MTHHYDVQLIRSLLFQQTKRLRDQDKSINILDFFQPFGNEFYQDIVDLQKHLRSFVPIDADATAKLEEWTHVFESGLNNRNYLED